MNDLPKTTEERIDRLEKLYEKIYHDYELLSILIPRLTDILGKYWEASGKHRENTIALPNGFDLFRWYSSRVFSIPHSPHILAFIK